MRTLNRAASQALSALPPGAVHACTDITGFGLAGHASEMASASGVTLVLEAGQIPVFRGVFDLLATNQSGGLATNLEHFGSRVQLAHEALESSRFDSPVALRVLLHDPQTSGGLLIAANGDSAEMVERAIRRVVPQSRRVGVVEARTHGIDVLIR
jgi:selenide, water dikinase